MDIFDFSTLLKSGEKRDKSTAIAIGVFDGVHNGHKEIFKRLVAARDEYGADEAMVISFSINPKSQSNGALDTLRLREEYVSSFSINSFVIIDFSDSFSKISACGFIELLNSLCKPVAIVVGNDFQFGNPKASARAQDLEALFRETGRDVKVDIVEPILTEGGERISSTLLRTIIRLGKLNEFLRLSGQCYRVDLVPIPYRFISGDLVFSRASIHQLLPPLGVYGASLVLKDKREVSGVMEISGDILTFRGNNLRCIEAMQLDSVFLGENYDFSRTEERNRS